MAQSDLVAEVTGSPRRPDSAPRSGPEEMHRVAVHEAGHAVAQLLSSNGAEHLVFATIIPRLDGTLGFVASVPGDTEVFTRRTMLERLGTILAGRAAEEIVFGADDVGAGAGGSSQTSDLAVGTQTGDAHCVPVRAGRRRRSPLDHATQSIAGRGSRYPAPQDVRQTRTGLQDHRDLLDGVARALEQKQELSGDELPALATSNRASS